MMACPLTTSSLLVDVGQEIKKRTQPEGRRALYGRLNADTYRTSVCQQLMQPVYIKCTASSKPGSNNAEERHSVSYS
jgi:hypothetical protein